MFILMPVVFTNEFTPYIGQIINPILKALADDNGYVRDTALKAGQVMLLFFFILALGKIHFFRIGPDLGLIRAKFTPDVANRAALGSGSLFLIWGQFLKIIFFFFFF